MCWGNRPKGTLDEKLAFVICEDLFPMAWVKWEHKLVPINGKVLGVDTLRADVFVDGLITFKKGLIISVKTQNVPGTTDEKLPKFLHYEVEHYPGAVILWMPGEHWRTKRGQEYYEVAKDMQRKMPDKLIAVVRDTDKLKALIRNLAKREEEARENKKAGVDYVSVAKNLRMF